MEVDRVHNRNFMGGCHYAGSICRRTLGNYKGLNSTEI